jgi:hypothetical protein
MSWFDRFDPSTPQGMQLAGLLGGLNAMGAGLLQAGAPRPVGQPGPTLGDAFGAFGQGQQRGMMTAKAQRDLQAMQAFGQALAPDADPAKLSPSAAALRASIPENMRGVIGALPSDMQAQTVAQLMTRKTNPKDNLMEVNGTIVDVSSGQPRPLMRVPRIMDPEEEAQQRRIRAAGATRVDMRLPAAESEFEKNYGKGLADQALKVLQDADKATATQMTLSRMQELLPQITAGRLGPALTTITGFAQAVGMSPESLERMGLPKSATSNEMFQMLAAKLTAANIGGEGGVPAANFSNADMEFVKQMEANLSRRPETIGLALEARQKIAERSVEAAQSWNAARADGKTFDRWQQEWKRYVNANPLFGGSEWRPAAAGMATPARPGLQAEPPPNPAAPARIMSPQQYQALPSGTQFIAPDGSVRVKP